MPLEDRKPVVYEGLRYGIYVVKDGGAPDELASAPDAGGLGLAIVTLHEDEREHGGRLADLGVLGILDRERREWIALPWVRP